MSMSSYILLRQVSKPWCIPEYISSAAHGLQLWSDVTKDGQYKPGYSLSHSLQIWSRSTSTSRSSSGSHPSDERTFVNSLQGDGILIIVHTPCILLVCHYSFKSQGEASRRRLIVHIKILSYKSYKVMNSSGYCIGGSWIYHSLVHMQVLNIIWSCCQFLTGV